MKNIFPPFRKLSPPLLVSVPPLEQLEVPPTLVLSPPSRSIHSQLDQGVPLPLLFSSPSPPPVTPFESSSVSLILKQRCCPHGKKRSDWMKLKLLKKHGRMLALEEVVNEERVSQMHDVFGCRDCFLDPHSGHVTYCPKSMYNLYHPSHKCLVGVPCSCQLDLYDIEYL